MARIALAAWEPDAASVDASVSAIATNVMPRKDGYQPIKAPVAITLALPGPCKGSISVQSPAFGFTTYFAGTASKLYRYDLSTTGWADATPAGKTYSVPQEDYWSFSVYGSRLIATHINGPSQVIDIDTGKVFADLGGNPPRARFNGVVGEFLVLASLASDPNAIQWSDLGDIERWTPGFQGQQGDVQIFPDGGAVTGFAGGEFGLVFQERSIRRMVFSPGAPQVFDFSIAEENRGSVAPWSLQKVGGRVFFLDREGFFSLTGATSTPIGAERVNRFFADTVEPNSVPMTVAVRDATGPRILWSYRSKTADQSDPSLLDKTLLYDWLLDRWTFLDIVVRYGMAAASPATSIDSLTGNTDTLTKPFDSADYLGGVPSLAVFTADNRLGTLTGPALEATFETAEAMLSRPNRAYARGVRLDSDADDWRVQIGTRESLRQGEEVRFRSETQPNSEQFAPCHASGRYHRARVRIPAGTPWSYATAIEPDATKEGMR